MATNKRYISQGFRIEKHFWLYEFRCKCKDQGFDIHKGFCGGAVIAEPRLAEVLEAIRFVHGTTYIVSGYRCWNYHKHIYELRQREPTKDSTHLSGHGVDLWTQEALRYPDHEPFLKDLGVTGVGYHKDGGRIRHIDIGHETYTTWTY
jgi:uncharacterized protein YcbK (DUF882 family)